MTDVVGLYLNPPQQAIILCIDEKSQIQALDRTQPGLPIKKGRCGTMTHDYKRNGTTTLFAALETLQGKVIGECHERHRHQEFLKFLRHINAEFPGKVPLHLIMDNYGTHKHAKVKAWLKRNPRFVPHFVPTSSSWMNLVERWFGHLDSKAIRRGVFLSVADLKASIEAFLTAWNQDPNPSSGPRPWNLFRKSSIAVGEPWSKSSRVAPCQKPEIGSRGLSSYFGDTTLASQPRPLRIEAWRLALAFESHGASGSAA